MRLPISFGDAPAGQSLNSAFCAMLQAAVIPNDSSQAILSQCFRICVLPFCKVSGQVFHCDCIHIGKLPVFSPHGPDERVSRSSGAGVNRPSRRQHDLTVPDHNVPRFAGLAQVMENYGLRRKIKVEVDFGTPRVPVDRHRIPNASFLKIGKPHGQLAGFDDRRVYVLVDGSPIGRLCAAMVRRFNLRHPDWFRRMGGMRWIADQIEQGGSLRIATHEFDAPASPADIQTASMRQPVVTTIDADKPVATNVDYTQFASLREIFRGKVRGSFKP
jgi:hypothetical protein